jgi:hypothetical protein
MVGKIALVMSASRDTLLYSFCSTPTLFELFFLNQRVMHSADFFMVREFVLSPNSFVANKTVGYTLVKRGEVRLRYKKWRKMSSNGFSIGGA